MYGETNEYNTYYTIESDNEYPSSYNAMEEEPRSKSNSNNKRTKSKSESPNQSKKRQLSDDENLTSQQEKDKINSLKTQLQTEVEKRISVEKLLTEKEKQYKS